MRQSRQKGLEQPVGFPEVIKAMPYFYSDPEREEETYALPDIEVWRDLICEVSCRCGEYEVAVSLARATDTTYCPSCENEAEGVEDTKQHGYFYWFCSPGYMPDSSPMGPFATERDALEDARSWGD